MTSTQVAREPLLQRAKRKVERLAGPAGIFFKGFLKHPAMVGAIVPSSNRTIERVLSVVDWEECRLFVEYGPGVGTFCRPVLEKLRRDGRLIVIWRCSASQWNNGIGARSSDKPSALRLHHSGRSQGAFP